jgi:hypothetical protein
VVFSEYFIVSFIVLYVHLDKFGCERHNIERSDMERSHREREGEGSMSIAYGGGAEPQYIVKAPEENTSGAFTKQ